FIPEVRVAYPDFVRAAARNFDILPNCAARFIGAGGYRIPLALSALRPLSGHAGTADRPTGSFSGRNLKVRRIQQWLMPRCLGDAAHVFRFVPEVLRLGRGDGETRGRGEMALLYWPRP